MKATPKLQDTLEIFLEQIDGLEASLKEMKNVSPNLSAKINELKTIKIEPDLKYLQTIHARNISEFSEEINRLTLLFDQNQTSLKTILNENKHKISHFYFYILIASLITIGAVYFGIKGMNSQSQLKSQIERVKSYNQDLEGFIEHSQQLEKYNKWLEKNKAK
ncbi:hypothetical protein AB670_03615 [Chryseobacterium sp. MOF25P]|jgi:predicted RND superfamily exporter protein|uniref:hypothetical protein n=1 Tax=unclassified Chryseobacterium TaxID=2593645 RepID=UPI0008057013|nr:MULTISPECIES: hypothetical protein [unclassified Chryseobacterium]OBW40052.1 hypothetical protein AB670_03615 [Chryseobacterium sp. MOF25P]OBW45896.1 hypothetical protein AB671_02013 [Chryseobacterium sp. BGARF1]